MGEYRQAVRCTARSKATGEQCKQWAMEGQKVCNKHGGMSPQAQEKALARLELQRIVEQNRHGAAWKLEGHPIADPGEVLLLLISAWKVRASELANAIQELVDKHEGNLEKALTAETWVDNDGQMVKIGEHAKGLVELEFRVSSTLAQWSSTAIKANLEERRVRVAERNALQFANMLRSILTDERLGLTAAQRAELPRALERLVIDQEHVAA